MTTPLTHLSATELTRALATSEVSSRELVDAHLARIAAVDPRVRAFTAIHADAARGWADRADRERKGGRVRSALHGLPVTVKECFDFAGQATTIGIPSRQAHRATTDAAMVTALTEAGAIILGRTNVSQTMLFTESRNPIFGETKNPHATERSPGGSSGGEAAAIASGMSPLGVGTDIGGSVRVPAHFCGIAALKPTLDRLPMLGVGSGIPGQEAVRGMCGPMARTVADLGLFMGALDPTRLSELDPRVPPLPFQSLPEGALRGKRVGWYEHDGLVEASPALRRAVREATSALADAGATLVPFQPPRVVDAIFLQVETLSADGGRLLRAELDGGEVDVALRPLLRAVALPEAIRLALAGFMDLRQDDLTARLLRSLGEKRVATYFGLIAALRAYRMELIDAMRAQALELLVCPPYATPAFPHGGSTNFSLAGSYAMLFNLAQLPAGVVPVTRVRAGEVGRATSPRELDKRAARVDEGSIGLPVGVQIVGGAWQEPLVLAAMDAVESRARSGQDYPTTPVDPR